MTIFLLIAMALLLIAALERANRRQPPHAPGLHGADNHNDRDWARTKLDLLVLGDRPCQNTNLHKGRRSA